MTGLEFARLALLGALLLVAIRLGRALLRNPRVSRGQYALLMSVQLGAVPLLAALTLDEPLPARLAVGCIAGLATAIFFFLAFLVLHPVMRDRVGAAKADHQDQPMQR